MKKILYIIALMLCVSEASAETILVIDNNGFVTQKMSTDSSSVALSSAPTVINLNQTPSVSVVRETPYIANNYYYDRTSTESLLAAGVTTAVIGGLLFDGFRIHHHHRPIHAPIHRPIRHHRR